MNREFLKLASREDFSCVPAEAVKLFVAMQAEIIFQSTSLTKRAFAEGLLLSTKSTADLMEVAAIPYLTLKRHLGLLKSYGLIRSHKYCGVKCFKLGEVKEGKAVWNDFTPAKASDVDLSERKKKSESIKEAIRQIQNKRREEREIKEKLSSAVVKKRVGQFVSASPAKREKAATTDLLDTYVEAFKNKYASFPSEISFTRGVAKYSKQDRFRAKNMIRWCDNDVEKAKELIKFCLSSTEEILEFFKFHHPLESDKLFLKKVVTKALFWKDNGFPVYNVESRKGKDPVGHRYDKDADWSLPEHLTEKGW